LAAHQQRQDDNVMMIFTDGRTSTSTTSCGHVFGTQLHAEQLCDGLFVCRVPGRRAKRHFAKKKRKKYFFRAFSGQKIFFGPDAVVVVKSAKIHLRFHLLIFVLQDAGG